MINILKTFSSLLKNKYELQENDWKNDSNELLRKEEKHEIEIQSCRKVKTIKFC